VDSGSSNVIKFPSPARSAHSVWGDSVGALESAQDAERRGDTKAAAACRVRVDDLLRELSLTAARDASDRLAHAVVARELVTALIVKLADQIVAKGLTERAQTLTALMERIAEDGDDGGDDASPVHAG
jgi:hypothetical protein